MAAADRAGAVCGTVDALVSRFRRVPERAWTFPETPRRPLPALSAGPLPLFLSRLPPWALQHPRRILSGYAWAPSAGHVLVPLCAGARPDEACAARSAPLDALPPARGGGV